ncbi:DUF3509 domain-containing protein [Pseudomonas mangiferae]|nr:DUF3509 domain-containing protein [Pseudomonas mangiferae]
MELAQHAFTTAFPDFSVTLSANPDHSLVLVLRGDTATSVVRRTIPASESRSHGYLEKWISAIRRDLAQSEAASGTLGYDPLLAVLPRYARH